MAFIELEKIESLRNQIDQKIELIANLAAECDNLTAELENQAGQDSTLITELTTKQARLTAELECQTEHKDMLMTELTAEQAMLTTTQEKEEGEQPSMAASSSMEQNTPHLTAPSAGKGAAMIPSRTLQIPVASCLYTDIFPDPTSESSVANITNVQYALALH